MYFWWPLSALQFGPALNCFALSQLLYIIVIYLFLGKEVLTLAPRFAGSRVPRGAFFYLFVSCYAAPAADLWSPCRAWGGQVHPIKEPMKINTHLSIPGKRLQKTWRFFGIFAFPPPQKQHFKITFFFWWEDFLISEVCFLFFVSRWIQSDPPHFCACNIHSWSIDCYSSGNYLKRESSCAFLMDCACLCLLYMDRELVWRSVILFSRSIPFLWRRISPVFTPYFSSSCRMTRLDDLESWWRWISLSLPLSFLRLGDR